MRRGVGGQVRAPGARRESPARDGGPTGASQDAGVGGLLVWRHAAARGAAGRCIGRTDLRVDPRRAKRLAHRIRATARREGLPRVIRTSPLARAAATGRWLRRWGWRHVVDPRLSELDFGDWDGRRWDDVPRAEIDAWAASLAEARPGGGESQAALCARVAAFVDTVVSPSATPVLAVSHGGWITAALRGGRAVDDAAAWPAPPRHGALVRVAVRRSAWTPTPSGPFGSSPAR